MTKRIGMGLVAVMMAVAGAGEAKNDHHEGGQWVVHVCASTYADAMMVKPDTGATVYMAPDGGAADALREAQRRWGLTAIVTRVENWTDNKNKVFYTVTCGHNEPVGGAVYAYNYYACMRHWGMGESWSEAFAYVDQWEKKGVDAKDTKGVYVKP
jgi:hypothetical protein